jgi:hypothetical protein
MAVYEAAVLERKLAAALAIENWDANGLVQRCENWSQQMRLSVQHLSHQLNVFRHMTGAGFSIFLHFSQLVEVCRPEPRRASGRLSPNSSTVLSEWIRAFISRPVEFARTVSNSFSDPKDAGIQLFARATFPALFGHFLTGELLGAAQSFLLEIIRNRRPRLSALFLSSFLSSEVEFCSRLWAIFDDFVLAKCPIQNSSQYFTGFVQSLRICSVLLTEFHANVLRAFADKSLEVFAVSLIDFFTDSYVEYHFNFNEKCPLTSFFEFSAQNPKSPHFTLIYRALLQGRTRFPVAQSDVIPLPKRFPIVLCPQEALFLQRIASLNPGLAKFRSTDKLAFGGGFDPLYCEIPLPAAESR